MRQISWLRGFTGVALVGAICSCASWPVEARDPAQWNHASAQYRAAYQIAAARCDRRTPACDARTGVHYESRDACIAAKLPSSAEQADLALCSRYSLRDADLGQCVAEIRGGECGTGLTGALACRGKTLCPWDSFDVTY